jgi:ketoreductase RED2
MPHLRTSADGNIVMVTSIAGIRPVGSSIAYSMTKAALNQLTRLLAKSCGPVRVNAVAPGQIDTPWTEGWDDRKAQVEAVAPLARTGLPEDVAEVVLACIGSRYMTGAVVPVDGGITLWT